LCEHHTELTGRGANVIAVGGAADYQARKLQPDSPVRLLLDPEGALRSALDLSKLSRQDMLGWASAKNYARSLTRKRPGRISMAHSEERPTVVVLNSDLELVWGYEGRALGDYPDVSELVLAVG
jgi:hypothetical protein